MKFLSSSYAVDQDGVVFELSLVQKYSNQQNCKKSDFSKKVVALFDNKIAKCDDNKIYYMTGDGNAQIYSEVGVLDHSYEIYNLLLGVSDVVKIITVDQNNGVYYLLKNDGNIYKYVISRADTQSPYKIDLNGVIYSKENYGFINDFNYSDSNKISTYIMSNDKLYRMKKMNGEECDKFVDISCKYELVEDSSLMEYKRYISGFDGSMLITNYGKVFNILG